MPAPPSPPAWHAASAKATGSRSGLPTAANGCVAAVGAMGGGAAVVPLNTRLKGREAGDILRRTRARLLFTVDHFLGTRYPELLADRRPA